MSEGLVHSINVSDGGLPKLARQSCQVRVTGLDDDRQRDLRHHGGVDRAVSLFSLQIIEALQNEGHPVSPGSLGENLTIAELDWGLMVPGARVEVGAVLLELTAFAHPCENTSGYFRDGKFVRVSQKLHPGWSRVYARVVREGLVRIGDRARLLPDGEGR